MLTEHGIAAAFMHVYMRSCSTAGLRSTAKPQLKTRQPNISKMEIETAAPLRAIYSRKPNFHGLFISLCFTLLYFSTTYERETTTIDLSFNHHCCRPVESAPASVKQNNAQNTKGQGRHAISWSSQSKLTSTVSCSIVPVFVLVQTV